MLIPITIYVDIDELEIDYTAERDSLTTEYWGSVSTDSWLDVEINSVVFDGRDVELDDDTLDTVTEYLTNLED